MIIRVAAFLVVTCFTSTKIPILTPAEPRAFFSQVSSRDVIVRVVADVLQGAPGGGVGGGGGSVTGSEGGGLPGGGSQCRVKAIYAFQRVDDGDFMVLCFGMYVQEYAPGNTQFTCFTSTKMRILGMVWCFESGCMCRSTRQVLSLLALLVQKVLIPAPVHGFGLYVQAYAV